MTKLEEEIWNAQRKVAHSSNPNDYAKAAAEVAKKYIEKAFYANPGQREQELCGTVSQEELYQAWLKENGITE